MYKSMTTQHKLMWYLLRGRGSKAFLAGKQQAWLPRTQVFQLIGLALQKDSELGTQGALPFPGCANSSCSAEAGGAWLDGHKQVESNPL